MEAEEERVMVKLTGDSQSAGAINREAGLKVTMPAGVHDGVSVTAAVGRDWSTARMSCTRTHKYSNPVKLHVYTHAQNQQP